MSEFHLEVLPSAQRRLWDALQKQSAFLTDQGYYLAGGSALALQIGHRQSIDFDFFSQKQGLAASTEKWLERFPNFLVRDLDPDTLHADVMGVKTSFISAYRYPTLGPLVEIKGVRVAGILDIALMKLLAITHRATLRDYLDLAAILRDHMGLKELLKASQVKYGEAFNVMIPLRGLVSFTDIDLEKPILIDKSLEPSWQNILQDAVRKAAD